MAATEPEFAPVWGESISASPDLVRPSDGFIQAGWPLTSIPPSRGFFNWAMKFGSNAATYLLERGIPKWNSSRTYAVGAVVRDAFDNTIYVATGITTQGVDPNTDLGKWRPLFDRAGFPVGRTVRWTEQWGGTNFSAGSVGTTSLDVDTKGWTAALTTATTGHVIVSTSFDDGASGFPGTGLSRVARLKCNGADSGDIALLQKAGEFKFTTSRYLVTEFDAWAGTVAATMNLFGGIGGGVPTAGVMGGAYFFADSGGVWKAVCGDGTSLSSFVSTGVSVLGAWQRMRVELIGSVVNPAGATTQAKFYIDGVLVATITTALPVGSVLGTTFGFKKIASGADSLQSFVGPVQYARTY